MKQYFIALLCLLLGTPLLSWGQCTNDTILPTAVCQSVYIPYSTASNFIVPASMIDGGSSDNCGIAAVFINGQASDTLYSYHLAVYHVTLTVVDSAGNVDTCQTTVRFEDSTLPTAVCQSATVVLSPAGYATMPASTIDGGSTASSGISSLLINGQPLDTFYASDLGVNPVVLTVVDSAGNVDSCNTTITVQDVTAPTVLCQNITVYLDSSGYAFVLPPMVGSSSDAGGIASIRLNGQDSLLFSSANVGANSIVYMATDVSGNTSSCMSMVTVVDTFSGNTAVAGLAVPSIEVQLYPNPAREQLSVAVEDGVLEFIELRAITGQLLQRKSGMGATTISLSVEQFPQGLYLVVVQTSEGQVCQKVRLE